MAVRAITPMLATASGEVPEGDANWVLEPKYDGWRAILESGPENITLSTRTGKAIDTVPYIADAVLNLPQNTILDGEIVDLSGDASGQWNRTQTICSRKKVHVPSPQDPALTYVVFDLLELEGTALMGETLADRRKVLSALLALLPKGPVVLSDQRPSDPSAYEKLVVQGWEGVVCKRLDSIYSPGARNGAWIKCKPEQELDVEITGMFAPEAGSKYSGRAVGGFTFEVTHNEGTLINRTFKGKCGTGMDDDLREDMHLHPELYVGKVAVVGHCGIAPSTGALRFPALIRIRDSADKSAVNVRAAVLSNSEGSTKVDLLERALAAEERADELQERVDDLEARLSGAVKKAVTKGTRAWTRNYGAMSPGKLIDAIRSLRTMQGDAYERVMSNGADASEHLSRAEAAARKKGIEGFGP